VRLSRTEAVEARCFVPPNCAPLDLAHFFNQVVTTWASLSVVFATNT
jgi:hypothetical protein